MKHSNLSNEQWIELIRESDPNTINSLFNLLTGFLINKLEHSSPFDLRGFCEDIAQDTVIFIYQNTDRYHFKSKFTSWAITVAMNRATSKLRLSEFTDIELKEDYSSMAYELELSVEDRSDLDYLKRVIQLLDPKYRFVIEQTYLYYRTPIEIANDLDIDQFAYYPILNGATNQLRRLVRQDTEQNHRLHRSLI